MLVTGLALIVSDGTIVGVSLPSIIDDLGLDLASAQWVTSLYTPSCSPRCCSLPASLATSAGAGACL